MVLSDGMVHFLKIEKKINKIYQNYLVALIFVYLTKILHCFKEILMRPVTV